ncbi:MAG: DUF5060 domain-containing protein, partial [Chloroflexi bacterium]
MQPQMFKRRQVAEWSFQSQNSYENPFTDVTVDDVITGPADPVKRLPAFYKGEKR